MLAEVDWSATINDFRLAEAVLTDRFSNAATLVKRIGKKGDIVTESAYHEWPLFRAFRESTEFVSAYEDVYGYAYDATMKREADNAWAKAQGEIGHGD
jgi:alkyl sulfatase BDS1-like metallo-beta-lactamase superfamily hydrolase